MGGSGPAAHPAAADRRLPPFAGLPFSEVAAIVGGTAEAARKAGSDGIAALRRTNLMPNALQGDLSGPTPTPADLFAAATVTDEALAALRARLAVSAAAAGPLDVAYTQVDSPVGMLLLAGTEPGLVRVAYAREDHDAVLQQLAELVSPGVLRAPGRLDAVARHLAEYFVGRRTAFDVPLHLRLASGFRLTVVQRLGDVAYGSTENYAGLTTAANSPKAVRAAGSACANNPLPVVVPCHRIVRSDGTLGSYLGGASAAAGSRKWDRARTGRRAGHRGRWALPPRCARFDSAR